MAVRDLTLPSLGPRLAEFARRSGLAGMWTWWMAQLNALVPSKPRAALERRRMRPVLVFDGDHATLWRPAMDGERAVMQAGTTIALAGDAATVAASGRAAIATLADGNFGVDAASPKVVLSLPPRDVLRKTVVLPAAVEPNLRQTLAYDLDRHTPFKAEELYFDAVVIGRSPEKKEIRVDLVACRKAVVDAAMRHAAAWRATVAAAVPELPATAAASRLNLLPHESRASHVVWKRWQFWLPLVLVVAVALAAIAIPLWQKRDFAIALNTLANQARSQAAVSDALRAELETKAGDYNFALEKKYAYPSAFRVIDEVSRVLPDDTWLTQMEMKTIAKGKENQRELLVRGESANAGRLVQLVEESTLFAQTAPRSPTTKIQPGPGEIFDLGAQVKPLAGPAQVALLGADKSSDAAANAPAAAVSPPTSTASPPTAPVVVRRRARAVGDGKGVRRIYDIVVPNSAASDCRARRRHRSDHGGPCTFRPWRSDARKACCDDPDGRRAARNGHEGPGPAAGRCSGSVALNAGAQTRARAAIRRGTVGRAIRSTAQAGGVGNARTRALGQRRQWSQAMTPAFVSRLSSQQQRALAVGLLLLAVVAALVLLAGPIVLFHRHYDVAIEDTSRRLELYRRVAAQAPDLRAALEVMKQKDGRRFFLRNTAPNLAGAELSDLVRAAIENNSGRITTSQSPAPREEGRFRQTFVTVQFFATTPALAKILAALDTQLPYVVVDNMTIRPLNAFRGFRPATGQEPELSVQMDVSAWALPEAPKVAGAPK